MGIKSTREFSRQVAIERIEKMDALIVARKYRDIESCISEDSDLLALVKNANPLGDERNNLENWTNDMLGDKLDEPLYRFSMFDNYIIHDDDDDDDDV